MVWSDGDSFTGSRLSEAFRGHFSVEQCHAIARLPYAVEIDDVDCLFRAADQLRCISIDVRLFFRWFLVRNLVLGATSIGSFEDNAKALRAWEFGVPIASSRKGLKFRCARLAGSDVRIDRALDVIASEYQSAALSAQRLAKRVGMSPSHFGRMFRLTAGYPFSQYVKLVRIRWATVLLAQTDAPINDIAAIVGYSYLSSFDRDFRFLLQVCPRIFRAYASKSPEEAVSLLIQPARCAFPVNCDANVGN